MYQFPLETVRMGKLLENISSTTKELKSEFENLEKTISDVNNDLANINTTLTTVANFSSLPNVTDQLDNIAKINNKNFAGNAVEVSLEALLVSYRISNSVCMCWF